MFKNYAESLHNIVVGARNPKLNIHSVCVELKEDAHRGLSNSIFFKYRPEYEVIMDNIGILKAMGFRIYIPKWDSMLEECEKYVSISWAREGESYTQGLKEL